MAQKVEVLLIDDLDGGEADETVTFALDGKTYEIDLSTANADKLRDLLDPFVKGGRKTGGRSSAGTRGRVSPKRAEGEPTPEELRKWAADNGYEVSARGRVPASIKEAYAAATK
ncbi:Lsr2-like DNA bridging protein [Streptomyces phage Success]|uniref:Lsr2-like DNA bridging protein n=1 Tax=Streptomyces phage Success TaxID=2999013 RepID=A0A9E8M5J1_9CAUD|nr:Lsr2-like DNA bridging protein [Streptomyces phage Success]WAB08850.1 Lsr2-like DNA bridging protein [Streptomyces phage Success]